MILYFTGTGNSKYIAEKLAEITGQELFSINHAIKNNYWPDIDSKDGLVFVTPTYAYRIPRLVSSWIRQVKFTACKKVWFFMNYGSTMADAGKYNRTLASEKNFTYMGTRGVLMPENYIALFTVPAKDESKRIIEKAQMEINKSGEFIKKDKHFPEYSSKVSGSFLSSVVNPIFYTAIVKDKKFLSNDKCISCGTCARLCPLNNITLEKDGRPSWHGNCTHCMACISYCPVEAIEYGKKSIGQTRYHIDKDLTNS